MKHCMRTAAVMVAALAAGCVLWGGCGKKGDTPPPPLTTISQSELPTADASAFGGNLEVTGVQLGRGGSSVIVQAAAKDDLGNSPLRIMVDVQDASGASLASDEAMLVLAAEMAGGADARPPAGPQPITAGSNVMVNVNIQLVKGKIAKIVLKPGGGPAGPGAPQR